MSTNDLVLAGGALMAAIALSACANSSPGSSAVDAGPFRVTDLGPGRCFGVSSDGHVVGAQDAADGGPFIIDPAGNRSPLPLYENDPATLPLAINAAGKVVGISQASRTAIVFANGSWVSVPPPAGGEWSAALDIDEAGNVVGVGIPGDLDAGAPALHAFYLPAGGSTKDLGFAPNSAAHRISSNGVLVGILQTDAGTTHAFRGPLPGGSPLDLGTLGGANSAAYGVNANGDVVGVADTPLGAHHAYLYHAGKMSDLGTLGGDRSDGRGIDDRGDVVGNSLVDGGATHPFLYRGQSLVDILPAPLDASAYLMARVEAIANGTAIGWGLSPDGTTHCLKWTVSP
jgi:probable HAF family extracellular repeat protein